MGVFLHYVYLTSRSLPLSMLLHALNNSVAVILSQPGVGDDLPPIEQVAHRPEVVAAMLLLVAAVAWALYQARARFVTEDGLPPWRPDFPGVEVPPAWSGTRVLRPWPGALTWLVVLAAAAGFVVAFAFGLQAVAAQP